jgi:outer membrane receptor protein involved in Fe transport
MLSGGFALLDAKLTKDYQPDPEEPIEAFKGDKLPVTPDFKANVTGRYEFPMGDWGAHAQAAVVYTGSSYNDLTRADREWTGKQAAYTLVDLAFGVARGGLNIDLYLNNAFNELERTTTGVSCAYWVCGVNPYYYPSRPRTLGLKISQQF